MISSLLEKRIVVFGDAMLDRYIRGKVDRVSPEAPIPVVMQEKINTVLGGAANVTRNLADFGVKTQTISLLGCPSEDTSELEGWLRNLEGNLNGLVYDEERPTTTKMRVLGNGQQIVRVDRESREMVPFKQEEMIKEKLADASSECDAVIVADYAKGLVNKRMADYLRELSEEGLFVAVDPHPNNPINWKGVDLLKPNLNELKLITGRQIVLAEEENPLKNAKLVGMMEEVLDKNELKHLLVTLSEHGMVYMGADGVRCWEPARVQEVFDVSGAGDTVISYFTLALVNGWTAENACRLANMAAGLVVRKLGTASLKYEEVEDEWKRSAH